MHRQFGDVLRAVPQLPEDLTSNWIRNASHSCTHDTREPLRCPWGLAMFRLLELRRRVSVGTYRLWMLCAMTVGLLAVDGFTFGRLTGVITEQATPIDRLRRDHDGAAIHAMI
jgi:hypothetical protein